MMLSVKGRLTEVNQSIACTTVRSHFLSARSVRKILASLCARGNHTVTVEIANLDCADHPLLKGQST